MGPKRSKSTPYYRTRADRKQGRPKSVPCSYCRSLKQGCVWPTWNPSSLSFDRNQCVRCYADGRVCGGPISKTQIVDPVLYYPTHSAIKYGGISEHTDEAAEFEEMLRLIRIPIHSALKILSENDPARSQHSRDLLVTHASNRMRRTDLFRACRSLLIPRLLLGLPVSDFSHGSVEDQVGLPYYILVTMIGETPSSKLDLLPELIGRALRAWENNGVQTWIKDLVLEEIQHSLAMGTSTTVSPILFNYLFPGASVQHPAQYLHITAPFLLSLSSNHPAVDSITKAFRTYHSQQRERLFWLLRFDDSPWLVQLNRCLVILGRHFELCRSPILIFSEAVDRGEALPDITRTTVIVTQIGASLGQVVAYAICREAEAQGAQLLIDRSRDLLQGYLTLLLQILELLRFVIMSANFYFGFTICVLEIFLLTPVQELLIWIRRYPEWRPRLLNALRFAAFSYVDARLFLEALETDDARLSLGLLLLVSESSHVDTVDSNRQALIFKAGAIVKAALWDVDLAPRGTQGVAVQLVNRVLGVIHE